MTKRRTSGGSAPWLIAALLVAAVGLLAGRSSLAQTPPAAQQTRPPTFRGSTDLIAVDVQVVDRDGSPVTGLSPDKFDVAIDGRRRRVVSADLVDFRRSAQSVSGPPASPDLTTSRVILLAIDCLSFNLEVSRSVVESTRAFVGRLPPSDFVGLFAYPIGPKLAPTTDHAAIARALDAVVGQREGLASGEFHLSASDIIDLSIKGNSGEDGTDLQKQLCGTDANCLERLANEVRGLAIFYEGQGYASLDMFRVWVQSLGALPGAKTVVLMSGGMVASDIPGGRPDLSEAGIRVGKAAAQANVRVYTLFLDQGWLEQYSAETRSGRNRVGNIERESTIRGRWLDQFSGTAGGALIKVLAGNGETAMNRILAETSAYYLLGVEPADADRDGRIHNITVKTGQRSLTLRGRTWVVVPATTARTASAASRAPASSARAPIAQPASPTAPVPRALSPDLAALAALFDRGDDAAVEERLRGTADIGKLIRDFRTAGGAWPDAPRRDAMFVLEIGRAGLQSSDAATRDDTERLLVQYAQLIRQPQAPDAFECTWYWAEVAAVEGLIQPGIALPFVRQAIQRCPQEGRFHLAEAVVTDQQWRLGLMPNDPRESAARPQSPNAAEQAEVLALYQTAAQFPDTAEEARLRAAWFCYRTGQLARARTWLEGVVNDPRADPQVRYLSDLVRGQVLRAIGQPDAATTAFRNAMATWPGAQSARIALMTLLVGQGARQEAESLAESIQTTPHEQFDPWWLYWLGDLRAYPAIFSRMRDLAR